MMVTRESFEREPDVIEAARYIDRARAGLSVLHIGPLAYNVRTTVDDLLVAIRLLERFSNTAGAP